MATRRRNKNNENNLLCRGRACPCPESWTYPEYGQGNRKGCPYKSCWEDLQVKETYQIVDVNLNRAREGLRVVEEIARFVLKDKNLTDGIRSQRHELSDVFKELDLVKFRDASNDLGRTGKFDAYSCKNIREGARKNFKRAEEGCRVIEELSKLFNGEISVKVKEIRFRIYDLEKELMNRLNDETLLSCKNSHDD
jgi:thiamine-phosphate pyrophosphorylase